MSLSSSCLPLAFIYSELTGRSQTGKQTSSFCDLILSQQDHGGLAASLYSPSSPVKRRVYRHGRWRTAVATQRGRVAHGTFRAKHETPATRWRLIGANARSDSVCSDVYICTLYALHTTWGKELTFVHSRGHPIGCCSLSAVIWYALCAQHTSGSSASHREKDKNRNEKGGKVCLRMLKYER